MQHHRYIFYLLFAFFVGLSACVDEDFSTSPSHTVSFSTDTLSFDTVFSTIGSTTKQVMVYNTNNVKLRISEIKLGGGNASSFRLNVDGRTRSDNCFTDIELRANDSLYIFVEVLVDPTNSNSPVLIKDSIQLQVNGTQKKLQLQAFGQDVVIFRNKTIYNDTLLSNAKPYLIYGDLVVDSMKRLEIEAGSVLYFHSKGNLRVKGNLVAKGTLQQPIIFRGDRLDIMPEGTPYDYLPEQWGGIQLTWSKGEHTLEYISLRNGKTGIEINNEKENEQPKLNLHNSLIYNFSKNGIYAKNAEIVMSNSEITNCGTYCLYLLGGNYSFAHTTIANYYKWSFRATPSVILKNYLSANQVITTYPLNKAEFKNCIIHGSNSSELKLDNNSGNVDIIASFNYLFKNCLLKSPEVINDKFESTVWSKNTDSVFVSTKKPYNFELYKNSPAINKGDAAVSTIYPFDILGINRLSDTAPDLGAYEWVNSPAN